MAFPGGWAENIRTQRVQLLGFFWLLFLKDGAESCFPMLDSVGLWMMSINVVRASLIMTYN